VKKLGNMSVAHVQTAKMAALIQNVLTSTLNNTKIGVYHANNIYLWLGYRHSYVCLYSNRVRHRGCSSNFRAKRPLSKNRANGAP
jgi:hypothetical protein